MRLVLPSEPSLIASLSPLVLSATAPPDMASTSTTPTAATINTLPFEVLDLILSHAADLNARESITYTYGLTEAPQPLQHVTLERHLRGRKPEDALRWVAVNSIRQVSSTWRQWALGYAVKELYIRRWRGSERWIESRHLPTLESQPSGQAVYRQPYNSLKEAAKCVTKCPDLASHVRRLWFDGLYTAETNADIFKILAKCHNLQSVTLPWIALRYGSADFWRMLLHDEQLKSLELTAIDLMKSQLSSPRNQVDHKPLMDPNLSFHGLSKLKIFGNTNFRPVTDHDLRMIARTATELEAVHVTGISSVSISGIMSLVKASSSTLRVLEYSPLSADGFAHPDPDRDGHGKSYHCCPLLLACPRLTDLSTSVPTICPDIFRDESVGWTGDLQIRAARICGDEDGTPLETPEATAVFKNVLGSARRLIDVRREAGEELDVEIFISSYIFTPSNNLVHGNFEEAQTLSEFTWPSNLQSYTPPTSFSSAWGSSPGPSSSSSSLSDHPPPLPPSSKGPYGQTGLYGKDIGPYSCISEDAFFEGVADGWVTF